MSAIAGLVYFDHRPLPPELLAQMSRALAPYGPDGNGRWQQGSIGLVQRQLILTPEDQYEDQPLRSADGQLVLVSDARLDNRPELLDALHITLTTGATLPDSALILKAYERWGPAAPKELIGDYAFALWNSRQQQLLLARSPLGVRPLYYHQTPDRFAFATMPRGLWALPFVPRALALEKILERDGAQSFFRDIHQVPPGARLLVSRDGIDQQLFWQLDLHRRLHFRREEEYGEAFCDLFERVVSRQLRSLYPIGVSLSGGLDSASVAATAARQLAAQGKSLTGFTAVPRAGFTGPAPAGTYADESPLVQALAARYPNLQVNLVDSAGRSPFANTDHLFDAMQGFFRNVCNRPWLEAIHEQARQQQVRVLLTGSYGNLTVSWRGSNPIPAYLQQGRWRQVWREVKAHHQTASSWRGLVSQGILPLLPMPLVATIQRWRNRTSDAMTIDTPFHPRFADIIHAQQQSLARMNRNAPRHFRQTQLTFGRADYGPACEARFGVNQRDPTGDLRIVEFCFALPEAQFRQAGESRRLIRHAMRGRLPPALLNNRQRGFQAADWYEGLTAHYDTLQADVGRFAQSPTIARLLDLPRLHQWLAAWPQSGWDEPAVVSRYGQLLPWALMIGRFILWFEEQWASGTHESSVSTRLPVSPPHGDERQPGLS